MQSSSIASEERRRRRKPELGEDQIKRKKFIILLVAVAVVALVLSTSIYFYYLRLPSLGPSPAASPTPLPEPLTNLTVRDIVVDPGAYENGYVKMRGRVYFSEERLEHVFSDGTGEIRLEYPSGVDPLIGENVAVEGYVRWLGGKSLPYIEVVKQYRNS